MRKLLKAAQADDAGFTIVEVIVSMVIFALIAVGVSYSTATSMRLTSDTRSREVATNLAASEIDSVLALDAFEVFTADPRDVTVGSTVYTIDRFAGWVSASGTTSGCGTGTGQLQYKRINVSVTWPSMLSTSGAARADTILASSTRLNDPATGSIFVSAIAADGTGSVDNTVTITPTSGGAALADQPDPTDEDGCAFAFHVAPGTYKVTLSKTGSVDVNHDPSPDASVTVTAGGAVTATFQYDAASNFAVFYAPTLIGRILPSGLRTTYVSGFGPYTGPAGTPSSIALFPFGDGYSAFGGEYATPTTTGTGCVSVDPAAWAKAKVNGKDLRAGERYTPVSTSPGGNAMLTVPMGGLLLNGVPGVTQVRVVSSAPNTSVGDPGCYTAQTYTYTTAGVGSYLLAVPYGTWTVQEYLNSQWVAVNPSRYSEPTNIAGDIETSNTVTIDPRAKK